LAIEVCRADSVRGILIATGQFTRVKGKNVLWAYVCGDSSDDSHGNCLMVGHTATVVSAAWARRF
jgi:hypothetical protein